MLLRKLRERFSGEWGTPFDHENLFHPNNLNCGQWADVAKSPGVNTWCLRQNTTTASACGTASITTHDVGSSSWGWRQTGRHPGIRGFRPHPGLKVGLYYSIWTGPTA